MAKAKKKETIYDVTVAGEYFAGDAGHNVLKPYRETVKMLDEHRKQGVLSVFKNLVAPDLMPQKYDGYTGLYTHRLISVVDAADPEAVPADVSLMNLPQLIAFVDKNELPIDTALYTGEDDLRQAVIECLDDEDVFQKNQRRRKSLKGNAIGLKASLNRLNPELTGSVDADGQDAVNMDKVPEAESVKRPKKHTTRYDETIEFDGLDKKTGDEDDIFS